MDRKKKDVDERVDVNFESHPPIEDDLDGITTLLRQTLLHFADCGSLAKYLIELKDVTQVIALEPLEEENTGEDDEPDNDIYGVVSLIDLQAKDDDPHQEARKQLIKFLRDKSPELKRMLDKNEDKPVKLCLVVNERYINLPPQLSLPTFKNLTTHLDKSQYTHLVFVAKIQLKTRSTDTKLPSKKSKTGASSSQNADAEPLIFVNPEEEIIFEHCDTHQDIDVSSFCDENASWSFSSDVKYIPHRRIMIVESNKWSNVMKDLEKELN